MSDRESTEPDGVEFRVHGIGDHDDWSELGSPRLVHDGSPRGADVALPPSVPGHPLLLLNWSRTSRKRAGWLWYLVLPYTLANAAGYMGQAREDSTATPTQVERHVRVSSVITGLVLTVLTYVWLVAIVETITRRSFLPVTSTSTAGTVIAVLVGVALFVGLVVRRTRPGAACPLPVQLLNLAVLVAVAVVTLVIRPAHRRISADWFPTLLTTHGPSATYRVVPPGERIPTFQERLADGELVPYLDAPTTTSLLAIAVTMVLVLGLLARSFLPGALGRPRSSVWGSVIALMSAVLLMVSVASALRLFIDNLVFYLSRKDLLPWGDPVNHAPYSARIMLPPLNTSYAEHNDYDMDLLPLLGITAALALTLGLLLRNLGPGGAGRPRWVSKPSKKTKPDKARVVAVWHRRLVLRLPRTLAGATLGGGILWAGGMVLIAWGVDDGSLRFWQWAVFVVQAVSVLAFVVIIAGRRIDAVKKPFSMFADLLGFWPIASHPLAGASYRAPVVRGIREQLEESTATTRVLVGHSQGSVLSAWAIAQLDEEGRSKPDLVTCGSPLRSLYAAFFPRHFDDAFFDRVRARSRWANFWRETDPIATPVTGIEGRDRCIDDPDGNGELQVHGNYWIAPEQQEYIAARIAAALDQPQDPVAAGDGS